MSKYHWTKEQYELWKEEWMKRHPNRNPPTFEEFNSLMEMFRFTFQEVCLGK